MKIGDIVTVTHAITRSRHSNVRKTVVREITPKQCIYLGDTFLQEGHVCGGYSYEDSYEQPYLRVSRIVKVSVVQRIPKSGKRFLKPFYTILITDNV